jgi:hypothetical protein
VGNVYKHHQKHRWGLVVDTDRINRWLTLSANIGVIAGLIFVAIEIRTNTESNMIAIDQTYATNWMTINTTIAANPNLAAVFEKGLAGEELDRVEARQFDHLVSMYQTQSNHMLRLYDLGLISEAQVRGAYRAIRRNAQRGRFREEIEASTSERNKGLILDPDGLDKWLNVEP